VDARGGTELAEPLRRALSLLGDGYDDRERVIVLVTDGQVGNEDHILRELAPNMKKTRMFALGIDQAVNAAFLKRLAGAGGGLSGRWRCARGRAPRGWRAASSRRRCGSAWCRGSRRCSRWVAAGSRMAEAAFIRSGRRSEGRRAGRRRVVSAVVAVPCGAA